MSTFSEPADSAGTAMSSVVAALRQRCGIEVPQYQMKILRPLVERLGGSSGLEGGAERLLTRDLAAWNEVVEAITVPETYFFRHYPHFQQLAVLAAERFRSGRPCNVLSAGCSSGEEAWSIAAVLDAQSRGTGGRGSVLGWDIHGTRLVHAAAGVYRDWSVRTGLHDYPGTLTRSGEDWKVGRHLHPWVRFEAVNLVAPLPPGAPRFDAIFFRNVAIYWKPSVARDVVTRLSELLVDDGMLLVGPCDPLSLPAESFEHRISDGVRTYRRKKKTRRTSSDSPAPRTSHRSAERSSTPAEPPMSVAAARMRRPTRRAGTDETNARPSLIPPLATQLCQPDPLAEVKAHADRGDYGAALELLRQSGLDSVDASMWEGVLHLNLEEPQRAVHCLRRCVYLDPDRLVYRQWLAVAYQAAGMTEEAERERRNALDPRMR